MPPLTSFATYPYPILPILYQGIVYWADLRCIPGIHHQYWHTVFPSFIYYRIQLSFQSTL